MLANEGGYDPCDSTPGFSRKKVARPSDPVTPCDPGFVLDTANGMCNTILQGLNHYDAAEDACGNLDAEMIQFEKDTQAQGFISLLNSGLDMMICGSYQISNRFSFLKPQAATVRFSMHFAF